MKLVLILFCLWGVCQGQGTFEEKWMEYSKVDPTDPGGDSTINAMELSTSLWKYKPGYERCYGAKMLAWKPKFTKQEKEKVKKCLKPFKDLFMSEKKAQKCIDKYDDNKNKVLEKGEFLDYHEWIMDGFPKNIKNIYLTKDDDKKCTNDDKNSSNS